MPTGYEVTAAMQPQAFRCTACGGLLLENTENVGPKASCPCGGIRLVGGHCEAVAVTISEQAIRVRAVGDPGGDNPEWVRQAWLGVEFDAIPLTGTRQGTKLVSGTPVQMEQPWAVDAEKAIEALKAAGQEDAVEWWRLHGSPGELLFEQSSCVPVSE